MIYEELRNYLSQASDPVTVELFDGCVTMFDNFNLEGYMDTFDAVVGDCSDAGDTAVIDALRICLRELLDTLLGEHTIVLHAETPISKVYELCNGLYLIQNTRQQDAITLILESEQSAQEHFAELMQLVTTLPIEETLSYIESINDSFTDTAKSFFLEVLEESIIPAEQTHQQFVDYAKLKERVSDRALFTDRFFQHVEAVGLPYLVYLRYYMAHHNELLNIEPDTLNLPTTRAKIAMIATDAIAMACLSKETVANAKKIIEDSADDLFSDLSVLTAFLMEVTQQLLGYNRG